MDRLQSMRVFTQVVESGSFAGAAKALDLSTTVVSRLVADLEEHIGARLINRTTRRMALTEVGESYFERVRPILLEVQEAEAMASSATAQPQGQLRVRSPSAFAVHQLAKVVPGFLDRYPKISIEVTTEGQAQTVDQSHDVSIFQRDTREQLDGDFIARRLARAETVLCAAPEYLNRNGRPEHPNDLERFNAMLQSAPIGLRLYRTTVGDNREEESWSIELRRPTFLSSDVETIYSAALHGLGIAFLPSFVVEDALTKRALERVLPEWQIFQATIYAGILSRRHLPARTRAFIDFLVEVFGGQDEDPWLRASGR